MTGGRALDYAFTLSYEFTPGSETSFGTRTWNGGLNVVRQFKQGSEHLGFDSFGSAISGIGWTQTAAPMTFDPNALGVYTFALNVFKGGNLLGPELSMNVNAVPLPAADWLLGSALLGLVGARRLKRAPDAAFAA